MDRPSQGDAPVGEVGLRRFPYPFVAAASITGDLDDLTSREAFVELVRFWNTPEETALGPGLDLELGHSFWFYDATGACDVTVFRGITDQLSQNAALLESLIRAGYVDSLHTYGDFSGGGFRRELAIQAVEYLSDRGLRVEVWVNHGWWRGTPNVQGIGPLPEQLGDDPGSPAYHTDLLVPQGLRFVERYEIVHTVGQDARPTPRDRATQLVEALRYGASTREWRARAIFANRLVEPWALDDGQRVFTFKRFIGKERGLAAAGSPELARALDERILDELRAKGGYMLVYTHPWRNPGGGLAAPEAVRALRNLAREHHDGRIYVTTTRKLLTYNVAAGSLDWSATREGDALTIRIGGVDDAITGRRPPAPGELEGITFYTPLPGSTRILVGDVEIKHTRRNPPDGTGVPSVTIPTVRLALPPLG
jgi:hypothetical protein